MTTDSGFEQRRMALEEDFFHRRDKLLLEEIRKHMAERTEKENLKEASCIDDETLLDHLVELGIKAESLLALSVYPLVNVAWADGIMEAKERDAVLAAAEQHGCTSGSPAHQVLQSWLEEEPSGELFETWKDYTKALLGSMPDTAAAELRSAVIGRARRVARATGGLLGIGAVSPIESAAIHRIENAMA